MRKTQILAAMLSLCIGTAGLPVSAAEITLPEGTVQTVRSFSGTCGRNLSWDYSAGTKTLTISGTGEMMNIENVAPWYDCEIVSVILQDGVTSIGEFAFSDCEALTSVTIPDGVTSIGTGAFANCRVLPSVTIPKSVTSIGSNAFSDCTALTSLTIPERVTSIGYNAFYNTPWLEQQLALSPILVVNNIVAYADRTRCTGAVVLPDGVTSIGDSVFESCQNMTSVTIPDSVTAIGDEAFLDCSSLSAVTIPNSVTEIGNSAFSGTAWLNDQLMLSPYVVVNHIVIDADPMVCTGDIVLPADTKAIGSYAFSSCNALTSLTIPEGVTSIGESAFSYCTALDSVTIPESVTEIGLNAFDGTPWIERYLLVSMYAAVNHIIVGSNTETCSGDIVIPDGMTNISGLAFFSCESMTSVTIPESVTKIGYGAFEWCSSMTKITIMNPKCEIFDDSATICNDYFDGSGAFSGTICGYENSTAQAYAQKYNCKFESLGAAPGSGNTDNSIADVNGDGVISIDDASLILKEISTRLFGSGKLTEAQCKAADVNGDGELTVDDASVILQYLSAKLFDNSVTISDFIS